MENVENIVTQGQEPERISNRLRAALIAHFNTGIPIAVLGINESQKEMVARIDHVYWQFVKNPLLDVGALLYQMAKARMKDGMNTGRGNAHNRARFEERVFEFVLDNVRPPSRKVSEAQVRAAGKRLMQMGMETDNGKDLAEGAKIIMKLDRLDQSESEHADLSKAVFLPPVVVTDVTEVDPTKERVDDAEVARIMSKYGGYVDEKRTMVEERVKVMEASGMPPQECDGDAREGSAD